MQLRMAPSRSHHKAKASYHEPLSLSLPCPLLQVSEPLSVDDGTLTRTMKPRRPAIAKRHAAELERLLAQLRG